MTDTAVPPPVPVKVCPHCAAQAQTTGDFCPYCGRAYSGAGASRSKKGMFVGLVAGGVVVIAVAIGATIAIAQQRSDDRQAHAAAASSRSAAAASASASAQAAEAAQAAADLKAQQDSAAREERAESVKAIEKSVKKDATQRYKDGVLEGPIKSVSCTPTNGGSTDDLDAKSTTYECFAVYKDNKDGTSSGYTFDATMNWDTGSYTWQLAGF